MTDAEIIGKLDTNFSRPASLWEATPDSITFCVREKVPKPLDIIRSSQASVIIIDRDLDLKGETFNDKALIRVDNPRESIIKILNHCFSAETPCKCIDPTASVHKDAIIHPSVHIGPNCAIGKATIRENTIIHANVVINDQVQIGKNVIVLPGCVIGFTGFGYYKDGSSKLVNFPHYGGVIIGDDVEIGANTCIDRGTLGNTVIKNGAKIDNLCHIAHNVTIGENSMVIALAMVGGSTKTGDGSWIAPGAVLRDGISIGRNSLVGLGAVVVKDVPDNTTVIGNPAKPFIKKENQK